jgi:hypothetical protein
MLVQRICLRIEIMVEFFSHYEDMVQVISMQSLDSFERRLDSQ